MSDGRADGGPVSEFLADHEAMLSALWVVAGVMLLFVGRKAYGALLSGGWPGVLVVTQSFLTGIGLVIAGVSDRVDLRRWGRPLAYWTAYTLLVVSVYTFLIVAPNYFASDVALFESWSGHLLTAGINPMDANMLVSRQVWNVSETSANITATLSGGVVDSYSYPGGSLWLAFLEAALLPTKRLGLSYVLLSTGLLVWLIHRVDIVLVPVALLVWMAPVARTVNAAMGMITPVWLVPLAVGLACWYADRYDAAAVGLGAAAVTKQLAWPVVGLVAIHVLRTRGRRQAARFTGIMAAVGVLLVGWLVVWNPVAWFESTAHAFLPIGDPLVAQGVGLTSLTVGGVWTVPRTVHRVLVLAVASGLIVAVWTRPAPMRWVIPFASIIVLVVHYRTLPSYYHNALPLALVALDARFRSEST